MLDVGSKLSGTRSHVRLQYDTVSIDWFGMFLAWLFKLLILRYGGIVLYRRMLPLFIGLILGTSVGIGGASLLYAFYYY